MKPLTTEELEQQSQNIMDKFDFEKVHKYMVSTEHQWYLGAGEMGVPDVSYLRKTARVLLAGAVRDKEECASAGTGGFVAYKLPWGLELTFQLTWSS